MKPYIDEMVQKESARANKPTRADKKRVKRILLEFFIDIDIPDFNTVADLERWQRKTILNNNV